MYRLCVKFLFCFAITLAACSSSSSKKEPKPPVVTSIKPGTVTPAPEAAKVVPANTSSSASSSAAGKAEPSKPDPSKTNVSKSAAKNAALKNAPSEVAPAEPPPIPSEASQRFELALSMMNSGDLLRAESEFQKLTTSYPDYSGPFANLGVIYLKSNRLADAEKALTTATKLSPLNAAAFNQLGIVYRNLGKFKEADVAYTSALAADSGYALAYYNLAVLTDMYLQQPKRALEAFERYQTLVPKPDPKVESWVKELRSRLGIKATVQPKADSAISTSTSPDSPPADTNAARSQ